MKGENPQAYLVTVPYNDLRAMEARCELLSEIEVDLEILIDNFYPDKALSDLRMLMQKIKSNQQT